VEETAALIVDLKRLSPLQQPEVQQTIRVARISAIHIAADVHAFDRARRNTQPACAAEIRALALTLAPAASAEPRWFPRPERNIQRIRLPALRQHGACSVPVEQRR